MLDSRKSNSSSIGKNNFNSIRSVALLRGRELTEEEATVLLSDTFLYQFLEAID